jgi:hypothetical protein
MLINNLFDGRTFSSVKWGRAKHSKRPRSFCYQILYRAANRIGRRVPVGFVTISEGTSPPRLRLPSLSSSRVWPSLSLRATGGFVSYSRLLVRLVCAIASAVFDIHVMCIPVLYRCVHF